MLCSLLWALGRAGTESDQLYESNAMKNATHILIEAGDIKFYNNLIHKEVRKISDEGMIDPTYSSIIVGMS